MVTLTVPDEFDQKKLDKFLRAVFPKLPISAIYKALRHRDIRVDSKRIRQNVILSKGSRLEIYIRDELLYGDRFIVPLVEGSGLEHGAEDAAGNVAENGPGFGAEQEQALEHELGKKLEPWPQHGPECDPQRGLECGTDNRAEHEAEQWPGQGLGQESEYKAEHGPGFGPGRSQGHKSRHGAEYKTAGQGTCPCVSPALEIVYEDANILLVNKRPGIPVHPDVDPEETTLIDLVHNYLKEKGEYNPSDKKGFKPSLCHRLDRNTGGLVIIAKNQRALEFFLEKIKKREIRKYYLCWVKGCPIPLEAELRHYLTKDERKSRVFVSDKKERGSLQIITRYKVLQPNPETSLLEVELVTGRTHQIRAHLAYIGHPIVGDGKYGENSFNRKMGAKIQMLWAYRMKFDFRTSGRFEYLNGRSFEVENVEFNFKGKPKTSSRV